VPCAPRAETLDNVKRFIRILILAIPVAAALFYALYLGAGNWVLRSGVDRWLNRRPERLLIQYESAWTFWPGVVHVEGFQIRGQTRTVQWWGSVDRGTLWVRLWDLQDREFVAGPISGEGVSFRLRRRADSPSKRTVTRPGLEPPIPGLENPPSPNPEALYPPTPRQAQKRRRDPWRVRLANMEFENVREIWIEEVRFAGKARAAGGFDLHLRRRFELDPTRLEIAEGGVHIGKRQVMTAAGGQVTGRIDSYSPARHRGWDVLRFTSGRAEIRGQVPSLAILDLYLKKTRWLDTTSGAGSITADVRMRRGRLLPGSELVALPENLAVEFLDYRAQGAGRAHWQVLEAKGGRREGRLLLNLDDFQLQRHGYGQPHVQGDGLRVAIATAEPNFPDLFTPTRLSLELPEARVPRLAFYNAYLPEKAGFALTGGSGRMTARFQAAAPDWTGSGAMQLTARGVKARFEGKPFAGNLRLDTNLRSVDLDGKRFDISGSKFELTDVVTLGAPAPGDAGKAPSPPWWARAHLDRAVLAPGALVYLRTSIEATLSDARPVFLFFAPAGRKRVLGWVQNLLDVQGVGATADVEMGESYVKVTDLAVAGGKAQLQGRLRLADGAQRGILYASYGRLDVGLELQDGERDWKILRPKKWYAEYPPFE
jgi:hypothetical protein